MTNIQQVVVSVPKSDVAAVESAALPAGPPFGGSFKVEIPTAALFESTSEESSPTSCQSHDLSNSWILSHPSALSNFDEIVRSSKGKKISMFLDYDGTLSSIVEDPDLAYMTNEMREALRNIAMHFPTAIVSGRCTEKVYDFVQLSQLYYAGSHGMDIKGPAEGNTQAVLHQPAIEFIPMIEEVYKVLLDKTKSIPGARVEKKKFCLSVHYRCVEKKKWSELRVLVRAVTNDYPKLGLYGGSKVIEIRPTIDWDKGRALVFLLEALGFTNCADVFPIYIGDDLTDEDAFKVLREKGHGIGILVSESPKETNASYSLKDPFEVMDFLKRLVE
ncbi:unnamed protein product [Cuscuta europaea]|uniref:Trehalose 6-phosphate phosphatase n=2 Tax=Cuscuta europaea TaxID=41803 RepID=A0A9P0ZJW7_CUSEU|nr:unnamed protein product [Cuscuta europaea]